MTPLDRLVREEIRRNGPIGVAELMNLALNHPRHGYYATRKPIGAEGDFVTAPEISQMFGELLAVWAAAVWQRAGRPHRFALVEIGPGRGTLMRDAARTAAQVGGFAPELHLVETSPSLRDEQRRTLEGHSVTWHETFEAFAATWHGPFVLLANELLDALPARQFVHAGGTWRERMVTLEGERLVFAAGAPVPALADTAGSEGEVREASPAREGLVARVARTLASRCGGALFVDYGSLSGGTGDTLQAVRRHAYAPPLERLGLADLTTHVDFAPLLRIARENGCEAATTTQGAFLLALGLLERAGRLGRGRSAEVQERIRDEVERLAAPGDGRRAMGELFKVLALCHPSGETPPGLAASP